MSLSIREERSLPDHVLGIRREANQLCYGPSQVLVAVRENHLVAAVRTAMRDDPNRRHGLIADLQFATDRYDEEAAEALLTAAETQLAERGATKIHGLILDGQRLASYFYRRGFWPSRKTVVIEWDLAEVPALHDPEGVSFEQVDRPDEDELVDFIRSSYQPYWRWWKEHIEDRRWFRVEYPAEPEPPNSRELDEEMRARVRAAVREVAEDDRRTMFLARAGGRLVGAIDAIARPAEEENFELGALVLRDFGGRGMASALLGRAHTWLRGRGLERARVNTTSGLDDYDPTVYLYVMANGGVILAEYVNLVKHVSRTGTETTMDAADQAGSPAVSPIGSTGGSPVPR